jgi:hypothetical protein
VRVVYSRDMREKNPIWCVGRLKYNVCFEKCKAVKQYTTKCQERLQNDQRNRNPSSQFMLGEYDFPILSISKISYFIYCVAAVDIGGALMLRRLNPVPREPL